MIPLPVCTGNITNTFPRIRGGNPKAYTHLDSGLLTEDDIAEVEALAQAYYDALDADDKANAEGITL